MKIAQEGQRAWITPSFFMIVEGTEGLVAVTKENEHSNWTLTHVRSGYAFSLPCIRSKKQAVAMGLKIYNLLGDQLKTKSPKKAVAGWTRKRFIEAIS